MTLADERRLAPEKIAALHAECAEDLRRLALGVLHDVHLAADVVKAIEQGHTAEESLRGWLFRVALNEALALRRRQGVQARGVEQLAWLRQANERDDYDRPDEVARRREEGRRAREALDALPAEQRQVVWMRFYEQKTFAAIADELKVPLGTTLWRMQAAIKKLRECLGTGDDE
ncbi:MAG: hypothetical protein B7Z73_11025 [Planctomycetia bacterium 21-64-5]|nr:MAG: hypothetical protein B7Z73_11025 [Planctomycetia bacterium 21-64-5]